MDHVSIGWVWLDKTLNGIITELNKQKPLSSASVALEESPNGTMLKVVAQTPQSTSAGSQSWPAGVGWQQVALIDNSSGTCVTKYMWVWGTGPTPNPTPAPKL